MKKWKVKSALGLDLMTSKTWLNRVHEVQALFFLNRCTREVVELRLGSLAISPYSLIPASSVKILTNRAWISLIGIHLALLWLNFIAPPPVKPTAIRRVSSANFEENLIYRTLQSSPPPPTGNGFSVHMLYSCSLLFLKLYTVLYITIQLYSHK